MKICFLLIATNKYISFLPQFIDSARKHAFKNHEVDFTLFTNHTTIKEINANIVNIPHEPWPMPTLKRYDYFYSQRDKLLEYDYLFYSDVDMKFVADIGDEALSNLVATIHPGFYNKTPLHFTYERNPESNAYIPYGMGKRYYAGGFNGGSSDDFINMAMNIVAWRQADELKNIIPVWHDESYLNKFLSIIEPTLELTPSYCYPESWNLPFEKKLLALDKNHAEMRS
jgi:hypothetical protein